VLSKLFEALYLKVFVNIVVKNSESIVYIEMCSKNDVVDSVQSTFETTKFNGNMLEFINEYVKESPFYYISILDTSTDQGAIPTCNKNRLSYYHDISSSEYKCYDGKWTYYTSKTDLYELEKNYKVIGLDFIFSPFSILSNFFKDKINLNIAVYVLIQDNCLSLCIFKNSELLFADYLDMDISKDGNDMMLNEDINEDIDLDLDLEDDIDLEDVDVVDDVESLDDFSDIEDLDTLEEIDEFSENKDVEEEFYETDEVLVDSDNEHFNEDYQRFSLIQTSINHFYKDDKYDSEFLENIYIADFVGVSSDLKRYLEEEMFLSVYIRHIDLAVEVCELAKLELK
jgi:hypothetical protein